MKVRFWGTRGTRPTPGPRTLRYGGNTTCVEVRDSSDRLLIIDSGSGIAELGATLNGTGPLDLFLLISHTHWDHIQGFPFFGPNFVPGTRITVVGPAGSIKSLQGAFADQMDPAYFPLRLDQVPADLEFIEVPAGVTFSVGKMQVTPHEMNHPIVTLGYRIEEDGSSFVFATDNELQNGGAEFCASMAEWCKGADLLAHDAQYSAEEYPSHVGWGHSTYDDALSIAETAGVRQLAFVHHDPLHSDSDIDALVEDAMGRHQSRGGRMMVFAAAEEQLVEL
ncbi:MAG TPA: MBL fold metallo-hydrolase [Candidatus Dormibacteraeota bacterium]